jgi:lipoprotein-anchoring transpeptidase ErfK/SrfK
MDVHLKAKLPYNRDRSGTLAVQIDGKTVRTYEVLGRGSQGPGDTVFQTNGNTPTGTYQGIGIENKNNQQSYGPVALRLKAVSGDALIAHDAFGRDGLLIHGGSLGGPGYWRGAGQLRATHGCLRLSNDDMLNLQTLITSAATNPGTNTCDLAKVTISVETEEYDYEHGLCNMPENSSVGNSSETAP